MVLSQRLRKRPSSFAILEVDEDSNLDAAGRCTIARHWCHQRFVVSSWIQCQDLANRVLNNALSNEREGVQETYQLTQGYSESVSVQDLRDGHGQ
jgi:hypothetical protein